jgi:hypothetical protein
VNQQTAYDVQHWLCCIRLAEKRQVPVHFLGVKRRLNRSFVACSREKFTFYLSHRLYRRIETPSISETEQLNLNLSASNWLFILLFIIQDARSNEIKICVFFLIRICIHDYMFY